MALKRKRGVFVTSKGLAPGEWLKRSTLPDNTSLPWAWVGTEVVRPSDITPEHCLVACGLSKRNKHPFCWNKFVEGLQASDSGPRKSSEVSTANGELDNTENVIVISDERPPCTPQICKSNPNCLNYLGEDDWEDEDKATEAFMKALNLGDDPSLDTREPDLPVGLKNLGATCYANASLQVWFRDLTFRSGVYKCKPSDGAEQKFKESPIFQLQVTFAALQQSIQSVFNPNKLVESLQLRTSEQQDAQEFSKLFMSHLDAAFMKQATPEVRSLVTDQFQGKQVYGTICNHCQYLSERAADFLEIEVNLENNSKLEDRIAAALQPETLSDDNKYFCSQCDSLQDATRYTELRALPPILHFSLLRFVYDVSTLERKKSKHVLSFPITLDMNRFLGSVTKRSTSPTNTSSDSAYELRGILLHKGPSAYYGHYEAQVYDATFGFRHNSWFQCSDETITKIRAPGERVRVKPVVLDQGGDNGNEHHGSQRMQKRIQARKRHRVDSNDEGDSILSQSTTHMDQPPTNKNEYISSKDAYMLIYTRKVPGHWNDISASEGIKEPLPIPDPPNSAVEVVNMLNAAHNDACDSYNRKEKFLKAQFKRKREVIRDIYRTWNVQSVGEDSILVSRQALAAWLSQHKNGSIFLVPDDEKISANGKGILDNTSGKCVPMDDILCDHRQIDPRKAGDVKRISKQAYYRIMHDTGWKFEPVLTDANVCDKCVKLQFQERLYQIEHPQLVNRFDQISDISSDFSGHWISKAWVRDWRLTKPKMHVLSDGDPAPDSPAFQSHVVCEHQGLSWNTTSRRRISAEATNLLQTLYPSWSPLSTDSEPCHVCGALLNILKKHNRELRKQAEEEKAMLRHMYDNALSGDALLLENIPCAIIPASFVKSWKQWLNHPTEVIKPHSVDNLSFICEHDMLVIDPNSPTDLDSSVAVIKRGDWEALETIYPGGPLIAIEKQVQDDEIQARYTHDVPVCTDCRIRRKYDWTSTTIVIRLGGTKQNKSEAFNKVTYSKVGVRQSKRLRQIRVLGERRRLTITKSTTVKEIQTMVQNQLDIPTVYQELFYNGKKLDDNIATAASLGICANDVLDLCPANETDKMETDSEENEPRNEGRGFGGTLLGGSVDHTSCSPPPPPPPDGSPDEKTCPACTFINDKHTLNCMICGTLFT